MDKDYAIFYENNNESEKYFDFRKVALRIKNMNEGVNNWVTKNPIRLSIFSSKVPDLNLVDLPGFIQINTKDQPVDLSKRILEIAETYISNNNIILAVSAADVDLANSESLKIAKRYDPSGERTLGIITKIDLIEENLYKQIIENNDYSLKNGFFGINCKNPEAIETHFSALDLFDKTLDIFKAQLRLNGKFVLEKIGSLLDLNTSEFNQKYFNCFLNSDGYLAKLVYEISDNLSNISLTFNWRYSNMIALCFYTSSIVNRNDGMFSFKKISVKNLFAADALEEFSFIFKNRIKFTFALMPWAKIHPKLLEHIDYEIESFFENFNSHYLKEFEDILRPVKFKFLHCNTTEDAKLILSFLYVQYLYYVQELKNSNISTINPIVHPNLNQSTDLKKTFLNLIRIKRIVELSKNLSSLSNLANYNSSRHSFSQQTAVMNVCSDYFVNIIVKRFQDFVSNSRIVHNFEEFFGMKKEEIIKENINMYVYLSKKNKIDALNASLRELRQLLNDVQ